MLLVTLAALALQAVQDAPKKREPVPRGMPQNWITDADYPPEALRARKFGTVGFRLDVDAAGQVTACHLAQSSGYSDLDERVCDRLLKRARFSPAQDGEGKGVPSTYSNAFYWILSGGPRRLNPIGVIAGTPTEVVIALRALPKGYANPAILRLVFTGEAVRACHVERSSGDAGLDRIACERAGAQVHRMRADNMGVPNPDSRMAYARFEAAK